jgi:formate hydrogenlyase subunit 3/multisubunit Na+/H+ antiporter MnhD subunit
MRHLNAIEKGALLLAAMLVVGGAFLLVHPSEITYFPQSNSKVPVNIRSQPVHLSKTGVQITGGLCIFLGLGIGWFTFYRGRK